MPRIRTIVPLLLLCAWCLVLPCFGQWSRTSTFSAVPNLSNCVVGQNNCWHTGKLLMNATNIFVSQWHVIALDSSGYAYLYNDYPTNTWTKQTAWGPGLAAVQYDGSGNIYALTGNCSGSHYFSKWNGSGWTTLAGCFVGFSLALDSSEQALAYDSNGTIWYSTDSGGTWSFTDFPWCVATSIVSIASNSDAPGEFLVSCGNDTVWHYSETVWTKLSTIANLQQVTAGTDGTYYMLAGNSVYHYTGSGVTWDHLAGSGLTSIAYDGVNSVWATGPLVGGNTANRYSETAIRHTRTIYNATGGCPQGINCTGATHTYTVQAGWDGVLGTQVKQVLAASSPVNLSATADYWDPFNCLEEQGVLCYPSADDNLACSVAGQLFNDNGNQPPSFKLNLAVTRFLTDPAEDVVLSPTRTRYYMQQTWCANTTHPDFTEADLPGPPIQSYTFLPYRTGFDLSLLMVSYDGGSTWEPLPSAPANYIEDWVEPQNTIPLMSHCTLNGQ